MPVHDWTRVDAGLFHDFHQTWAVNLRNALNAGVLPPDYFALVEQRIHGPIADVLTLRLSDTGEGASNGTSNGAGGLAVATAPPRARIVKRAEPDIYAARADRITVRHRHGDVVAVVEIVSPGNKGGVNDFRAFVEKSADLVRQGVHLLVIDLFPPGKRDPFGVPKAIWDQFVEEDFDAPADKPLTVSAIDAGSRTIYVDYFGVGDALPGPALFLKQEFYVPVPLEATYEETWRTFPGPLKGLLEE